MCAYEDLRHERLYYAQSTECKGMLSSTTAASPLLYRCW